MSPHQDHSVPKMLFKNKQEAEDYVKRQNKWVISRPSYEHKRTPITVTDYHCNVVAECPAKLTLKENKTDNTVQMYRKGDHDHEGKPCTKRGLSDRTKIEIDKIIFNCIEQNIDIKLKEVCAELKKTDRNVFTETQVKSYINNTDTLLRQWFCSLSEMSEDIHAPFVASLKEFGHHFGFTMTTTHLLSIAYDCKVIHATKSEWNWRGCPIIIVGTTDRNNIFYPLVMTIANSYQYGFKHTFQTLKDKVLEIYKTFAPNVLVYDDDCIKEAFATVFGSDIKMKICWRYARTQIKACIEKLVPESMHEEALSDIDALHSATTDDIIKQATDAFLEKWKNHYEFISKFKNDWVNKEWYLGVQRWTPGDNSALLDLYEKSRDLTRNRNCIDQFKVSASERLSEWSKISNHTFAQEPIIPDSLWEKAYLLPSLNMRFNIDIIDSEQVELFRIPVEGVVYKTSTWILFDEFKQLGEWHVKLPIGGVNWRGLGECTCPAFGEQYICEHVLAVAYVNRYQ